MSFDISNDAEFLNEIQDINLDDAPDNEETINNNQQDEKSSKFEEHEQTNSNPDSSLINSNTKTKQRNKRRTQAQGSKKKRPILDLSAFDFGAIDEKNDNDKNSIQESTKNMPSNFNEINSQPSMLEERITNYLELSLSSLKSEVLNEIEYIFNRKNSMSSIVDSFLLSFASDIRNEIHYLRSFLVIDQPINISIEIDLPKPRYISYQTLSSNSFLNQISSLKTQYTQKFAKIGKDISNTIKNRDSELSHIFQQNKQLSSKLRQLQSKSDTLKSVFDDLDHKIRLISHQNSKLNEKIKEIELNSYHYEIKQNDFKGIKNEINDLSNFLISTNQGSKNTAFYQKIKDINFEVKEISNSIDNTSKQALIFSDSFQNLDYQLNFLIQQNLRTKPFRNSAPQSRYNFSQHSPLLSSVPKMQDIQFTPRISKDSFQSPVYARKTPNYTVESDDDDDDILQTTNYLLNKQFSPPMPNYS